MTERTFTIHREGIDRFTAIVDGDEVIAVRAADYDAMETARDMCAQMAHEAEAELAHIKRFLKPTGWQKAQDEHNALRAELAEATDLLRLAHLFVDTSMFDAKLAERIEAWLAKRQQP